MVKWTHVYRWREHSRKGLACRIVTTGKLHALVEFVDGYRMVTSRCAVRRRKVDETASMVRRGKTGPHRKKGN